MQFGNPIVNRGCSVGRMRLFAVMAEERRGKWPIATISSAGMMFPVVCRELEVGARGVMNGSFVF